jgi:hypothetical protein
VRVGAAVAYREGDADGLLHTLEDSGVDGRLVAFG